MNGNKKSGSEAEKKEFFLVRWVRRLFFPHKELDIYQEEQVQSPVRTVIRNFMSKKTGVAALITLIVIALFVIITPIFVGFNPAEQDSTTVFVAPGLNMLSVPLNPSTQDEIAERLGITRRYVTQLYSPLLRTEPSKEPI